MGPFKIVNFGFAPTPTHLGSRPIPFLGQESSQVTDAASAVQSARKSLERVTASYESLAISMGKENADQAYREAAASLEKAQADYDALVGGA